MIDQIAFEGTGNIGQTHWADENPGKRYMVAGHLAVLDPSILGTVRLRFTWTDKTIGACQYDVSLLSTVIGVQEFSFSPDLADGEYLHYQLDRLALTGTVTYNFSAGLDYY